MTSLGHTAIGRLPWEIPMAVNTAELVTRAIRLHNELQKIRAKAQTLPYGDILRWKLSLRAERIGQQLKEIHAQHDIAIAKKQAE